MSRKTIRLAVILVLIGILMLIARNLLFSDSGKKVIVSRDGIVIAEYPLSMPRTEVIKAPDGAGSNTLHIGDGEAWVTDASCPDKICEQAGKISTEGELIVCMPNLLIVQVSE